MPGRRSNHADSPCTAHFRVIVGGLLELPITAAGSHREHINIIQTAASPEGNVYFFISALGDCQGCS